MRWQITYDPRDQNKDLDFYSEYDKRMGDAECVKTFTLIYILFSLKIGVIHPHMSLLLWTCVQVCTLFCFALFCFCFALLGI
jgi:fatty-acid desaturase